MQAVRVHPVKELPSEEGWSLLHKKVCSGTEDSGDLQGLRDIGLQIVEKCHGVPLAIKTIGGVLRTKDRNRREWEKVLRSQAWSLAELPEGVMGALYLSYEDLPSHLKQCFLYCSLFPENYVFVRIFVVQLWIAEGFVNAGELAAEELAEDYYKELLKRSLLQPDPRYHSEKGCKMHSLTRFLAQYLAQGENFFENLQGLSSTPMCIRRLSMASRGVATVPEAIEQQVCLRTLLLFDNPPIKTIPESLFRKLSRLRVLDLMSTGIESLPGSICRLKHLRYLNLSFSNLTQLPESISLLTNLQFLILQGCSSLHSLPKNIARLYNLRALDLLNTQVNRMPQGLGGLQLLNMLQGLVVDDEQYSSSKHGEPSCILQELKSLSQMRILHMERLENAAVGGSRTLGALSEMSYLRELEMHCTPRPRGQLYCDDEIEKIKDVFEDLCPPPSTERLKIQGFFGSKYPSWMSGSSFPNLTRLYLKDCPVCTQLPPLGQLLQLRHLLISGMPALAAIGPEFCSDSSPHAFPKLEDMVLVDMPNLEEWTGLAEGALPCLRGLHIEGCPKLRALPSGLQHATALKELSIQGAASLREVDGLQRASASIRALYLVDNPNLGRVSDLPALQLLVAINCPALGTVACVGELQRVYLTDHSMDFLPEWLGGSSDGSCFPGELRALGLECSVQLLERCTEGGRYWPLLERIPYVYGVSQDGSVFISYTRSPFSYSTNIGCTPVEAKLPGTGDGSAAAAAAQAFLSSSASNRSLDEEYVHLARRPSPWLSSSGGDIEMTENAIKSVT